MTEPDFAFAGTSVEGKHAVTLHAALVHPEIPWNAGNLGRTCLAVGATLHLIEPLGFDTDDRGVRRAGLDYWRDVDVRRWSNWDRFEQSLPSLGSPWFFSADSERHPWQVDLRAPSVLVFGAESRGLPADLRERYSDRFLSLPMAASSVRSLNVSTAAAVALYEAVRQRSYHL